MEKMKKKYNRDRLLVKFSGLLFLYVIIAPVYLGAFEPNKEPPVYQVPWFYLLIAVGFVFAVIVWYRFKLRQLTASKEALNRLVEEQTEELEKAKEEAVDANRAQSRFFANISHEFRTPLTLIIGPLEQILAAKPGKEIEIKADMMLRNSRRLLNLINQLLELAKFESGKMKLAAVELDIVSFLRSIIMYFESQARQKSVELVFSNKEESILLFFDSGKIEKVITNLVSNALNYTPAYGKVTVTVQQAGASGHFPEGCVEISVRDTGKGIPAEQLSLIFDRFYRGEDCPEFHRKDSGLGLALTKELVDIHHGDISVKSRCQPAPDRGTEFLMRLPLGQVHLKPDEIIQPGKPDEPVDSLEMPAAHVFSGETEDTVEPGPGKNGAADHGETAGETEKPVVLVVDDNADVRYCIRGSIEEDYYVVEAADGGEGILRAREIIPDLVVSDVMMPGTDGYQLCRTLKNDVLTSHIPVILLTAKNTEESELEGLESGADDYIVKPVSSSLLMSRARNLIELRRQLQRERKNRMTFQPGEIPVSPIDDKFYLKMQETVDTNMSEPDFNVEALSRALEMSQTTLNRKVRALTGKTPTHFIRDYRLKRAAQLLETRAGNISTVAGMVGFSDKSYFTRCFKEQFNRLPSELQSGGTGDVPDFAGPIVHPGMHGDESRNGDPGKDVILVVEDNADTRYFIRENFETGYHVVEAVDGREGIARARELIPDLIISDIMMPHVNGRELCLALKKDIRTSHIPIILLTAKASEDSMIEGLETGADDYVTKPFNTKTLGARVKNLINLRSDLHKKRSRELALMPDKITESNLDKEFMDELDAVIKKNMGDPDFNVEQLAIKLYMSSATVYRKVKALTGEIPSEYIRSSRLRHAAELLKNKSGSVTEVAFEVGFNSRAYFTQCFKEKYHQLPSVYSG